MLCVIAILAGRWRKIFFHSINRGVGGLFVYTAAERTAGGEKRSSEDATSS